MKRRGRKPRQVVNPEPVPVDDNEEEEEDTIEVGAVILHVERRRRNSLPLTTNFSQTI